MWRFTLKIGSLAAGFLFLAVSQGGLAYGLAWPALSFGMVAAAYLLATGRAQSAEQALAAVRGVRPGARPNAEQVQVLDKFDATPRASDATRAVP